MDVQVERVQHILLDCNSGMDRIAIRQLIDCIGTSQLTKPNQVAATYISPSVLRPPKGKINPIQA